MLYISINQDTEITTDSWLGCTPLFIEVYIDDVLQGTFANTSTRREYIKFVFPKSKSVLLQLKEYKLTIKYSISSPTDFSEVLKEELVQIYDKYPVECKTIYNNDTKIKMYESK